MPDILLKERHRERRTAQFTETAPADLFLRQFPVSASPEHHGRTESAYRKRFSSDQITGNYYEIVGANGGGSRKNAAKQIEVNDSLYDDGEE